MRRLPGRYWPRVAVFTAVQEFGTVLNSPRWNVVTKPLLDTGADWCPLSLTTTAATISTTATAAPAQTQVIRDLRRERAAALRLRDPGSQSSRPGASSCQVPAAARASPPDVPPRGVPPRFPAPCWTGARRGRAS